MVEKIHPITNIYAKAMLGNIGEARSEFAGYLRDGISYPRGKMLDYAQGQSITSRALLATVKELKKAGRNEDIKNLTRAYLNITNNVFSKNSHPLVTNAYKELEASFKEIYPAKRTQLITKFIMEKQIFPSLKKFKWLTKFM